MTRTVLALVGRFLIEYPDGTQDNVSERDITPAQAAALRAEAQAQRQPRNARKTKRNSRAGSQPSKRVNYAALVVGRDSAGVNINKI